MRAGFIDVRPAGTGFNRRRERATHPGVPKWVLQPVCLRGSGGGGLSVAVRSHFWLPLHRGVMCQCSASGKFKSEQEQCMEFPATENLCKVGWDGSAACGLFSLAGTR